MQPAAAILAVLEAADGPLHWTVIQDRALRAGYLDPFETPDVRGVVGGTLRELASAGMSSSQPLEDAVGAVGGTIVDDDQFPVHVLRNRRGKDKR